MTPNVAQALLLEIVGSSGTGATPQGKAPHAYRGTPARRTMDRKARAAKRRLALRLFKGHRP